MDSLIKSISDEIYSFLQYRSKGDEDIVSKALNNIMVSNGKIYISNVQFNLNPSNDEDLAKGIALANLPLLFVGNKSESEELPENLMRIKRIAEKLINLKDEDLNEIATLEIYLLMEMGLRELYSEYVGKSATLFNNGRTIKLTNMNYRKLKLYLRMNHIGIYNVKINGEQFPYSQGALLNWAEKYMNKNYAECFKISLNVRNLLAHGELEWDLKPSIESLNTASYMVSMLFKNLNQKIQ